MLSTADALHHPLKQLAMKLVHTGGDFSSICKDPLLHSKGLLRVHTSQSQADLMKSDQQHPVRQLHA